MHKRPPKKASTINKLLLIITRAIKEILSSSERTSVVFGAVQVDVSCCGFTSFRSQGSRPPSGGWLVILSCSSASVLMRAESQHAAGENAHRARVDMQSVWTV